MNKKALVVILVSVGIIILAAMPRLIELISGNYVFGFDQGKHWLAAKSIVIDHKFPLIGDEVGGRGGFFQGPGWYYLLAIPFFFFQGDPYGAVVLMFGIGVGIIILFLSLFYTLLSKKEVLAVAFMLSLAPILISNSRFAWPPFVIPFLTVVLLWNVYLVCEKKYRHILGVFFTIGLMAHFEIATAGSLFISTVIIFGTFLMKEKIPIRYLLFGLVCFLIPLFPLIIFDIRHDFLNSRGVLETLTGSKRYVGSTIEYLKILSNHRMIFSDEFYRAFQVTYIPKIYLVGFMAAGSIAMIMDRKIPLVKKRFIGFLCLLPAVLFFVFIFYKDDLWPWWISELTVIYTVLGGIITSYAWKQGLIMKCIVVSILGLMILSYGQKTHQSFQNELSDYGGVHKIKGKKDALDVIFKDAQGEKFGLLVFTPPIYTYAYDYLIWWYGQSQSGYIPPSEKKGIFYLLIEPDIGEPWRHKGWIETVIKDGTIEKTWQLPSGFIIEKRTIKSSN